MKVGILVHGPHLQAKGWDNLAWGQAPSMMGRIPKAMQMFYKLGAEVIFFGTGASERDGIKEGQYMLNTLLERRHQLGEFDALKDLARYGGVDVSYTPGGVILYARSQAEVVVDVRSQNTKEELLAAGDAFLARGVTEGCWSRAQHICRVVSVMRKWSTTTPSIKESTRCSHKGFL